MRTLVRTAMLLLLAVFAVSHATPTLGGWIEPDAFRVSEESTAHAVVGSWLATTAAGDMAVMFHADGSVIMQFPDASLSNQGNSFVGRGVGTWEPMGSNGAAYTVVRQVSHANGVDLGTITLQGYLRVSPDGATLTDDGRLTTRVMRNARGAITSATRATGEAPLFTATQVDLDLASVAGVGLAPSDEAEPEDEAVPTRRGGGCNTCR